MDAFWEFVNREKCPFCPGGILYLAGDTGRLRYCHRPERMGSLQGSGRDCALGFLGTGQSFTG